MSDSDFKTTETNDELDEQLNSLLGQLNDLSLGDMNENMLNKNRRDINPYGRVIEGSNNYLNFSITNMTQDYIECENLTAMVGYLFRMCEEDDVPDGIKPVSPADYLRNPSLIECKPELAHKETKLMKEARERNRQKMKERIIVYKFLEKYLDYNPDIHVKSSYKPNFKDNRRKLVDTPAGKLAINEAEQKDKKFKEEIFKNKRQGKKLKTRDGREVSIDDIIPKKKIVKDDKNPDSKKNADNPSETKNADNSKNNPDGSKNNPNDKKDTESSLVEIKAGDSKSKNGKKIIEENPDDKNDPEYQRMTKHIPPADTLARFRRYKTANYDAIRDATTDIHHGVVPDIDFLICPHSWHSSLEEARKFQKKHRNEMITDIYTAKSSHWTVLVPRKANREVINYYNENTELLEDIMTNKEEEKKMGSQMLNKRISSQKKKNVKEAGPDDPNFKRFASQVNTLSGYGVENPNSKSMASEDCPEDAVQLDIFRVSDQDIDVSSVFIEAEAPKLVNK